MERKLIDTSYGDVSIHESKGKEANVLFLHGNSLSMTSFSYQLDSKLASKYNFIAIDLPGHGESEKALSPEECYSFSGYQKVILEIIEKLGLSHLLIVGHSLGGHLAVELLNKTDILKGIVIFGTPPLKFPPDLEHAYLPSPASTLSLKPDLNQDEIMLFCRSLLKNETKIPEFIINDVKNTDQNARAFLGANIIKGDLADEINLISKSSIPIGILHGRDDQLINLNYIKTIDIPELWGQKVQIVPNAGHTIQYEQPTIFNKLLAEFLELCFD